jgi:mono/diheme cytochrome c family protein
MVSESIAGRQRRQIPALKPGRKTRKRALSSGCPKAVATARLDKATQPPGETGATPVPRLKEDKMRYQVLFIALALAGIAWSAAADCTSTEKGKELVEKHRCALCHKEGAMASPLTAYAEGKTDEFLKGAIINPKQTLGSATLMPAYKLTDEEVEALIQYIRSTPAP